MDAPYLWGIEITEAGMVVIAATGIYFCWKIAKHIWLSL